MAWLISRPKENAVMLISPYFVFVAHKILCVQEMMYIKVSLISAHRLFFPLLPTQRCNSSARVSPRSVQEDKLARQSHWGSAVSAVGWVPRHQILRTDSLGEWEALKPDGSVWTLTLRKWEKIRQGLSLWMAKAGPWIQSAKHELHTSCVLNIAMVKIISAALSLTDKSYFRHEIITLWELPNITNHDRLAFFPKICSFQAAIEAQLSAE